MKKLNHCVAFGITSNLTFAVANVIIGIEKYSPGLVDKYIIFFDEKDPIAEEEMQVILKISSKAEFRELNMENVHIPEDGLKRFSALNYAKNQVFRLLNEFHKVLWLDADIVIQDDISEIFKYTPMAWRKTVVPFNKKISCWEGNLIGEEYTAPNGGVIFVSDELEDYDSLYDKSCDVMEKLFRTVSMVALDELTFGVLNFQYNLGAKELPAKYNSGCGWKDSQHACLVHSIGTDKFWNDALRHIMFPQWEQFNSIYLAAGGTNSPQKKLKREGYLGKSARSVFAAFKNYDYWCALTEKASFSEAIIPGHNYFKKYIQYFLKKTNKNIHYELIKCSDKQVKVALLFEKQYTNVLAGGTSACEDLISFQNSLSFNLEQNEKVVSLYKIVDESKAIATLKRLMAATVNWIMLTYASKLTRKEKAKLYLKFYYRKIKDF
ncbi:MAG: glycosyltransferase [Phascolarctobacterium sp.]|uniref:glycosyltransferase n=1 Tax=Phascolarctobacterium sp. TaxID=2049039 RepID=UPI0026DC69DF|nr:glycosyltransferase [Phascolarctobacterium sp.]MDO4920371.1 glycosyltransferase [Phascolarctobacterium sp.]